MRSQPLKLAIAPADQALCKKLYIKTIFDLILTLPKSYDNNFLSKTLEANSELILQVKFNSLRKMPKSLLINLQLLDFNCAIDAVFFNVRPYHFSMFQANQKYYIKTKLKLDKLGKPQLQQPKIINEIDDIVPIYVKSKNNLTIRQLMKTYLTKAILQKSIIFIFQILE